MGPVGFHLAGAVYDSCPGSLGLDTLMSSVEANMRSQALRWAMVLAVLGGSACVPVVGAWVWRRLPSPLRVVLMVLAAWAVIRRASGGHVSPWSPVQWRYWNEVRMAAAAFQLQELFLYSACDKLVKAGPIDQLVAERRRCSTSPASGTDADTGAGAGAGAGSGSEDVSVCARVHAVRWTDSAHVAHLHAHPEQYTSAVAAFLRRVQADERGSQSARTGRR